MTRNIKVTRSSPQCITELVLRTKPTVQPQMNQSLSQFESQQESISQQTPPLLDPSKQTKNNHFKLQGSSNHFASCC